MFSVSAAILHIWCKIIMKNMENEIPNNCSVLALISKSLSWNIWRVHLRADADQMVPQNWISFHVLQIENVILSNKYCFLARAYSWNFLFC